MTKKNKASIPASRGQNRLAILSQGTAPTGSSEETNLQQGMDGTGGSRGTGRGEQIDPIDRDMYPGKFRFSWDIGAVLAGISMLVGFVWYLSSLDSTVKSSAEDIKDLKKKSEDTIHFSIEAGVRITNIENQLKEKDSHSESKKASR